jgi:hypothetical protein
VDDGRFPRVDRGRALEEPGRRQRNVIGRAPPKPVLQGACSRRVVQRPVPRPGSHTTRIAPSHSAGKSAAATVSGISPREERGRQRMRGRTGVPSGRSRDAHVGLVRRTLTWFVDMPIRKGLRLAGPQQPAQRCLQDVSQDIREVSQRV